MNKLKKAFTVNVQLILLFLILGVFSVFSLAFIIWYNDLVETNQKYVDEVEELEIWIEDIRDFYSSKDIDRYSKPQAYKKLDNTLSELSHHLMMQVKVDNESVYQDVVEDEDGTVDTLDITLRKFKVSRKIELLLSAVNYWEEVKDEINLLNKDDNYTDTSYVSYQKDLVYGANDSTEKVVFRAVPKNEKVLNNFTRSHLKYIISLTYNLQDDFDELYQILNTDQGERLNTYHFLLWFITILDTLIFVLAYYVLWRKVIKPLRISKKEGDLVYSSGFKTNLTYNRADEIGSLTTLINRLVSEIKLATKFTEHLRSSDDGKLDALKVDKSSPLFEQLISLRSELYDLAKKEEERNWIISGQAIFSELLAKLSYDFESLSDELIEKLVKYTHCLQGGFFLHDKEKDALYLNSVYAYDRKKYINKHIAIGEGLVGQVWQERHTTYIENIPKEHVFIKSGLGEAQPRSLLIVPLIDSEVLYGVVELASFNKFKPYEIEFVEKICQSIATTLASVRVNEQTQKLLKESQMLTEQMKQQEDSMKVNLKELELAQEELKLRDIQRENELKSISEQYNEEIEAYVAQVKNLERTIELLETQRLSQVPHQVVQQKGASNEEIEELEAKYKGQIADLEETVKIKEMRIEKMRSKIAKLQEKSES